MADPQQATQTPSTPPPPQFGGDNALADKIRAKFPGAYDDMSDAQLAAAVVKKYPQYTDLSLPYDKQIKRNGQWTPVRSETLTPDERDQAVDYSPGPLTGHDTYEGVKLGLMGATAPLTLEATLPEIAGGLVGGAFGNAGAKKLAKAAGAGETGQEVAGDAGSVIGGAAAARMSSWATSGARAIYEALPEDLQALLKRKAVGVASPRLKNAIDLWDTLGQIKDRWTTAKSSPGELDATGENKDFAGEKPPVPARWNAHDATAENKPFAGGMDEAPTAIPQRFTPPVAAAAPAPVIPEPARPGAAGQIAESVAEPKPQPTPKSAPTPAPLQTPSGDPLLERLRGIARDIEQKEQFKTAAEKAQAAGQPEEDLTNLLLESLKQVKAKKVAVQ
jgi:hypothetical protein